MTAATDALLVRLESVRGQAVTIPAPQDLRFDHTVPGGYGDLSCTLQLPARAVTPDVLAALARVRVVDRRTGRTVWFGRLTDPGLTVAPDGQGYSVTAEGDQSVTDGWREVYALVDRSQDSWQAVGDFKPAQTSFSGDLTPGGDYDIDLGDFGDLIDFGGDLGIDFDGDLGFGGDQGDWGNIDFGGADYPPSADYPGYLGYLPDAPIPLGGGVDGAWWAQWQQGHDDFGGSATGTTVGTLTNAGRRRQDSYRGLMIDAGYFGAGGYFDLPTTVQRVQEIDGVFRLASSASVARFWVWADSALSGSGYYCEVTVAGISWWRVDAGVATELISQAHTLTVGATYPITVSGWPAGDIYEDPPPLSGLEGRGLAFTGNPTSYPFLIATVTGGGGIAYGNPLYELTSGNPLTTTGTYCVINPHPGQPVPVYALVEGTYWGVSATGGPVEFDSLTPTIA